MDLIRFLLAVTRPRTDPPPRLRRPDFGPGVILILHSGAEKAAISQFSDKVCKQARLESLFNVLAYSRVVHIRGSGIPDTKKRRYSTKFISP